MLVAVTAVALALTGAGNDHAPPTYLSSTKLVEVALESTSPATKVKVAP